MRRTECDLSLTHYRAVAIASEGDQPRREDNLMSHQVTYEWTVERQDERGDIFDTRSYDTLAEAKADAANLEAAHSVEICLVRDVGNQLDSIVDRQWAYLDANGKLPCCFNDGVDIPKRFNAARVL